MAWSSFSKVKQKKQSAMKKFVFLLIAFVSVICLTGCPGKEPEVIDLGTIPEKYLATVPYEDGQTFYLQHESDRNIIPFKVSRHRILSQGNDAWGFEYYGKYKPAPSVYFDYEVDVTTCKPDYPIFDIKLQFSNAYMADSLYYHQPSSQKTAQLNCHNLYALFPLIGEPTGQVTMLDSIEVNGHTYFDVFEFVEEGSSQDIDIKSFYYNYEKGVIAIFMSNGEKYLLYEEK